MRRILILAAAVALGIAALATGAWYWAAGRLKGEIAAWQDARAAEGYRIGHGPLRVEGFPLRVAARIADPVVAGPPGGIAWEWRAPHLVVELVPWAPRRLRLRNEGLNRVALHGAPGQPPVMPAEVMLDSRGLTLDLFSPDAGTQRFEAKVEAAAASTALPPFAAEARTLAVTLLLHRIAPGDHLTAAAELTATMEGLALPLRGLDQPADGRLEAVLMGAFPAGPPAVAVPAWRDDGGTVELKQLELSAGGVSLRADGTLALDRAMRPMGAGTAVIRGVSEAIDRLVAAGQMPARDATLAKLMLGGLATPAADGGPPVLTLPLSAQDGWVNVGPLRLARVQPLKLD